MIYAALVLAAALPTTWLVVGVLLIVVTLVALLLFVIKSREAASLKKEVMELRDTMRMMRYEEANLSRMFYPVDKSAATPVVAEAEGYPHEDSVPDEAADEVLQEAAREEDNMAGPTDEAADEAEPVVLAGVVPEEVQPEDTVAEEEVPEEPLVPEPVAETDQVTGEQEEELATPSEPEDYQEQAGESAESPPEHSLEMEETVAEEEPQDNHTVEAPVDESPAVDEPVAETLVEDTAEETPLVETPVKPRATSEKARKQGINERRPAIPTDLFAAWFEEYEANESVAETGDEEKNAEVQDGEEAMSPIQEVSEPVPAAADEQHSEPDAAIDEPAVQADEPAEEDEAQTGSEDDAEGPIRSLGKEDERFCRKLERIVHTRMRNPNLNIDVIASQFGMGRTNFYRKVRELMGMSPNDYLRKCRMERAAELLNTTELTITEVCAQVGIPDAQYFSRVFKTFYGTTPSAYREQR